VPIDIAESMPEDAVFEVTYDGESLIYRRV
jgi:hypothetical protein